jgi:hypothetical protein
MKKNTENKAEWFDSLKEAGVDKPKGRAPDYILKILDKNTESRSGRVGCAYQNKNGSIQILLDFDLNHFLSGSKNLVLTLFPNVIKFEKDKS